MRVCTMGEQKKSELSKVAIETMKLHQDDFDEITLVLFGERDFGIAGEDYPEFISTPSSTR